MHSTPNSEQTDPRNVFAHVNEEITRAYEQIALANEQIARTLAQDATRHPSDHPETRMTSDRPAIGRPALRGFVGLLLAACIGVAAIGWQSSYGDVAKQIIAGWAPQFVLTSSPSPHNPGLPEKPSPLTLQASAANALSPQPAPLAQAAPEAVAPTAAARSPDSEQLLQSMARDLATVGQEIEELKAGIEQLKTNQEQMARDNARAAEQFKASQEEMVRDIAKVSEAKASEAKASEAKASEAKAPGAKAPGAKASGAKASSEQSLRHTISAPPPRPTAAPTRKPVPILPSPQARAQP
jgi:uncharacterized membrane protein YccC